MPFSFKPHKMEMDNRGEPYIAERNDYILLGGHPDTIYYTPSDNKYWVAEGIECTKELFDSKFAQRIKWNYSQFQTDKVSGEKYNRFPATPENIAEKRKELVMEAGKKGERVDYDAILRDTSPGMLDVDPKFAKLLDSTKTDEKLAKRLNSSSRF